jgi:hypothetical protein
MNSSVFWFFHDSDGVSGVLCSSGGWVLPVLFMDGVLAIFSCFARAQDGLGLLRALP